MGDTLSYFPRERTASAAEEEEEKEEEKASSSCLRSCHEATAAAAAAAAAAPRWEGKGRLGHQSRQPRPIDDRGGGKEEEWVSRKRGFFCGMHVGRGRRQNLLGLIGGGREAERRRVRIFWDERRIEKGENIFGVILRL